MPFASSGSFLAPKRTRTMSRMMIKSGPPRFERKPSVFIREWNIGPWRGVAKNHRSGEGNRQKGGWRPTRMEFEGALCQRRAVLLRRLSAESDARFALVTCLTPKYVTFMRTLALALTAFLLVIAQAAPAQLRITDMT